MPDFLSAAAKVDRKLAQRSLYYLCKEILGYKDMVPHVHGDLCHFTTHSKYGRFRQHTVPRSWFKSWIISVGKSIWLTLPDEEGLYKDVYPFKGPNCRVLLASNVIDYSAKLINTIKRHWENNTRLQAAFPELVPEFNKTRWSDHCAEIVRDIRSQEGSYTAVGVGGSVIGQHFDHIIEDDLIFAKKDDFTGQELMPTQEDIDNAIGWHKLSFSLLANPQNGTMDNVGTRWAPHDLIDYIRTKEAHYQTMEITATRDGIWPPTEDSIVWPERYDMKTLWQIRDSQGPKIFECFPQEAPILMADWSLKSIKDVTVGDEVVGISKGFGKYKSSLTKSAVNLIESLEKPVVKVTLDSGRVIRCTADHPWYTGRTDKTHSPYLPARVGGSLLQVYNITEPTSEQLLDYRYLAGLVDGEGACKHGSIAIGQSKYANPEVYESIVAVVKRLGIPYKISTVNPNETHILRGNVICRGLAQAVVLGGGRQVKGDIIRLGRPAKTNQILGTIWRRSAHPIIGRNRVVSIEPDGVETVYAIGTTTGNYVAYGYATKNTQYLNRPRAGEDVAFNTDYLVEHESLEDFPKGIKYRTIVDLASWDDKKKGGRSVVLTGGRDVNNHLWISRVDAGKYNPSEVIALFREHAKQFNSKVLVEEIQYQRAIRHFAKIDMEAQGEFYNIEALPHEGQKNAKDMRIQGLEPTVKNGAVHILRSMLDLKREMGDYPYSSTVDILDCMGYLQRYAPLTYKTETSEVMRPFTREALEEEIRNRANSHTIYPFNIQLRRPDGSTVTVS